MAIYRFRVKFEEYDDVNMDIEAKAGQTFEHLLAAITTAIAFDGKYEASFYLSDENWKKGKEFSSRSDAAGSATVLPMKDSKLTKHIFDPHQKILLILHSVPAWELHIDLIKITNEEAKAEYPRCIRTTGTMPKQYGATNLGTEKKDFDFIGEDKFVEEGDDLLEGEEADPLSDVSDENAGTDLIENDEFSSDEGASPDEPELEQ